MNLKQVRSTLNSQGLIKYKILFTRILVCRAIQRAFTLLHLESTIKL